MEFKGTKGEWIIRGDENAKEVYSKEYSSPICAIARHSSFDSKVDSERDSNASIIVIAPKLLEALKQSNKVIHSLKMSMMAHPDCAPNSEFDDFTDMAQEIEDSNEELIKKATTI